MAFDLETRLLITLGHSIRDKDGTGTFNIDLPDFTADARGYIEDLISQIEATDEQYRSALGDSMAEQVDNLKVDYSKHLLLLSQRGSTLLKRLSQFTNVPMMSDMFTGQDYGAKPLNGGGGGSSIMVKAYY